MSINGNLHELEETILKLQEVMEQYLARGNYENILKYAKYILEEVVEVQ